MRWRALLTIVVGLWVWSAAPVLAGNPAVEILRISAGQRFVRVTMRVEKHEGTRKVCLTWYPEDLEDFPSQTCSSEEGLRAPLIYTYERNLPHGGIWYFKGVVERSMETVVSAPKPVIVGGP